MRRRPTTVRAAEAQHLPLSHDFHTRRLPKISPREYQLVLLASTARRSTCMLRTHAHEHTTHTSFSSLVSLLSPVVTFFSSAFGCLVSNLCCSIANLHRSSALRKSPVIEATLRAHSSIAFASNDTPACAMLRQRKQYKHFPNLLHALRENFNDCLLVVRCEFHEIWLHTVL